MARNYATVRTDKSALEVSIGIGRRAALFKLTQRQDMRMIRYMGTGEAFGYRRTCPPRLCNYDGKVPRQEVALYPNEKVPMKCRGPKFKMLPTTL